MIIIINVCLFLTIKSAYFEWFLKDHVSLILLAAAITGINYILKYIKIENSYFK